MTLLYKFRGIDGFRRQPGGSVRQNFLKINGMEWKIAERPFYVGFHRVFVPPWAVDQQNIDIRFDPESPRFGKRTENHRFNTLRCKDIRRGPRAFDSAPPARFNFNFGSLAWQTLHGDEIIDFSGCKINVRLWEASQVALII